MSTPKKGCSPLVVIVIEKDRHVFSLISRFLAEVGYESLCMADGYEALDYARRSPPSLIITEMLIPRLDGLALCRLIKGDDALRDVKVMVLSMLSMEKRALESGADAFMTKPIERERLINQVQALIAQKDNQEKI